MEGNKKRVVAFKDYYDGKIEKCDTLPEGNEYDFLLERNKSHMRETALTFGKKNISFEELHEKIDEYARALYHYGVRKGDHIGACVANTPESVYLIYAINKLGAVMVGLSPLNNEYKMARDIEITKPKMIFSLDFMYSKFKKACEEYNIKPILYSPLLSVNNPFLKGIYNIKQKKEGNHLSSKENRLDKIIKSGRESDVEYSKHINGTCTNIMFTGGSSGVHKGVMLDGNGLNCVVKALDHVLLLEPGMVHLGNIPFGHMCFGRLVLHYVLCKNATYALTLKAMPQDFLDEMIRVHANGAMGGPVHWEALIDNPKLKKGCLDELIQPLSGGELFKPQRLKQANEAIKFAGCKAEIGNGLGSTEMWAPTHVCVGGRNTPGTIGYEIPFVHSKIVDPKTFEEVQDGENGLLLVNGPGMMLEYFKNEKETESVFCFDENGTKWYNTKDIAKKLPTGEFEYIGRIKRNFVSGVDNIYPEQIEQLLLQIPEIREVAVTPIPDEHEQHLPKYHISLSKEDCDKAKIESSIVSIVGSTLGKTALPGYIEYYENPLPRTDNGKLDTTLLCQKDIDSIENKDMYRTDFR